MNNRVARSAYCTGCLSYGVVYETEKKAEELEIKYRKEQGLPDFVPSGAKVSSVGDDAAAAAEAESAAPVVLESTPETRATLVSRLSDLPDDSKSVVEAMNQLKAEGYAPRCVSEIL